MFSLFLLAVHFLIHVLKLVVKKIACLHNFYYFFPCWTSDICMQKTRRTLVKLFKQLSNQTTQFLKKVRSFSLTARLLKLMLLSLSLSLFGLGPLNKFTQSSGRSHCFWCSGCSEMELGTDTSSWNLQFSNEGKRSLRNYYKTEK